MLRLMFATIATTAAIAGQATIYSFEPPISVVPFNGVYASGVGDTNADGFDDVAAGSSEVGIVYTFSGRDGTLLRILDPLTNTGGAMRIAGVGDLDGDGYADLVLGVSIAGVLGSGGGVITAFSGGTGGILWQHFGTVQERAGESLKCGGDINGDGVNDVLVSVPWGTGPPYGYVLVLSGVDGTAVRVIPNPNPAAAATPGFSFPLASAGDIDGDGVPDIIAPNSAETLGPIKGSVRVFSGATGSILRTWWGQIPGDGFGGVVEGGRDVDGDGVPDILVSAPGSVASGVSGRIWTFSGATGQTLYSALAPPAGIHLGVFGLSFLGDVDGDGVSEFIASSGGPHPTSFLVYRGIDGSLLTSFRSQLPLQVIVRTVASAGDVNNDGIPDVVVGGFNVNPPHLPKSIAWVWSLAPVPQGTAVPVGTGCGLGGPPILGMQPPRLGTSPLLGVSGAGPNVPGYLYFGVPAASPIAIGPGCSVHVDPSTIVLAAQFGTDAGGSWSVPAPLPIGSVFAGLTFRLQAAFLPPNQSVELTNALDVVLGY